MRKEWMLLRIVKMKIVETATKGNDRKDRSMFFFCTNYEKNNRKKHRGQYGENANEKWKAKS